MAVFAVSGKTAAINYLCSLGCCCRIPLAAAHAGNTDRREKAGAAKRFIFRERLGSLPARNIHHQHAADTRPAVLGQKRSTQDQDVPMRFEIGEVRVACDRADFRAARAVFHVDGVEHPAFSIA